MPEDRVKTKRVALSPLFLSLVTRMPSISYIEVFGTSFSGTNDCHHMFVRDYALSCGWLHDT